MFCLHQHTWTQTGAVLKQEGLANICAVGKHVGEGGGELALTGSLVALLPSPEVWLRALTGSLVFLWCAAPADASNGCLLSARMLFRV